MQGIPYKKFFTFLILLVLTIFVFSGIRYLKLKREVNTYIGVVKLSGEITSQKAEEVISLLIKAEQDPRVGAVLLRIESPGGWVAPSQEIYRSVLKIRKKKKVIASIGTVGASGAYYAAAAANEIYADPGSITGSIGVIFGFPQFEELMKKLGIGKVVIKSGEFKDIASPFRSPTPEEMKLLKTIVKDIHSQFVSDIAKTRNIEKTTLQQIADGRLFTGRQAVNVGLVDGLKSQSEVIDYINTKILKLKGTPKILYFKKTERLWGFFKKASEVLRFSPFSHLKAQWEVK